MPKPAYPSEHYGIKSCREMVIAWLALYFVSAKLSLAAHKVMLVVPILAQECHVYHTEPHTSCIVRTRSHLHYIQYHVFCTTHCCVSIIEVMCIDRAYYRSFLSILSSIYGQMYTLVHPARFILVA